MLGSFWDSQEDGGCNLQTMTQRLLFSYFTLWNSQVLFRYWNKITHFVLIQFWTFSVFWTHGEHKLSSCKFFCVCCGRCSIPLDKENHCLISLGKWVMQTTMYGCSPQNILKFQESHICNSKCLLAVIMQTDPL